MTFTTTPIKNKQNRHDQQAPQISFGVKKIANFEIQLVFFGLPNTKNKQKHLVLLIYHCDIFSPDKWLSIEV
jgi:hypothetical protein